jgi:hypothetical protein
LLISYLSYSRFREEGASAGYLAIAIFTAALAMLSKETGAMFPWLLIAYEALRETPPGTARGWKQFVWTLPFFAVVGIYAVVRTALFGRNLGPGPGGSRLTAFADAPLVLIAYLRNLLWSFRLSFFYPVEWGASWTYLKGIGVVLVAVIVTWLWIRYRDRPGVRLQLLWTMILFVPPLVAVSTFVKEDWVHDRHMYSVSVPFCLIVAALLTDPKLPRRASIVVSMVILLLLSLETAVQVPRFSDGEWLRAMLWHIVTMHSHCTIIRAMRSLFRSTALPRSSGREIRGSTEVLPRRWAGLAATRRRRQNMQRHWN